MQHGGIELATWMAEIGRPGKATISRWVDLGMIKPVNILGKHFITKEEEDRFWARAKAGEFSKEFSGVAAMGKAQE